MMPNQPIERTAKPPLIGNVAAGKPASGPTMAELILEVC
jgi:hypothetical protein